MSELTSKPSLSRTLSDYERTASGNRRVEHGTTHDGHRIIGVQYPLITPDITTLSESFNLYDLRRAWAGRNVLQHVAPYVGDPFTLIDIEALTAQLEGLTVQEGVLATVIGLALSRDGTTVEVDSTPRQLGVGEHLFDGRSLGHYMPTGDLRL